MPEIRNYLPSDQTSWLRCRVLAFLTTSYFDDVWTTRPDDSQIQLVAVEGDDVVGLLDVCFDHDLATIDTVCVHPDYQGHGVATDLLHAAVAQIPSHITTIDAWTRDDVDTLAWYRARGFVESDHYLHVYKSHDEAIPNDLRADAPLHGPMLGFYHANLKHEALMRSRFRRVHVCRRMSQPIAGLRSR